MDQFLKSISSNLPAIFGLVGVLLGAIITSVFNVYISNTKRKNELRLAALDKRLEAHQQAYMICNSFKNKINAENKDRFEVINQFFEYWLPGMHACLPIRRYCLQCLNQKGCHRPKAVLWLWDMPFPLQEERNPVE